MLPYNVMLINQVVLFASVVQHEEKGLLVVKNGKWLKKFYTLILTANAIT